MQELQDAAINACQGGRAVAEHSSNDAKVKGSCLATIAGTGIENAKKPHFLKICSRWEQPTIYLSVRCYKTFPTLIVPQRVHAFR